MEKILLIEDLKTLQLLYSDELIEEGYQVIINPDGAGVLEIDDYMIKSSDMFFRIASRFLQNQ